MSDVPSSRSAGEPTPGEPGAAAREYEHLLIQLERLLAAGRGESEEHEELCDRMSEPWYRLDPPTQELLRGLSGDLYMLQGQEVLEHADEAPDILKQRLQAAWNAGDHRHVLSLLRRVQAPFFPADRVAYVRGRCWSALGFHEAALAFYDHAAKVNPRNGSYVYLAFDEVIRLDRVEEAIKRAHAAANDPAASSRALFAAGHALLWAVQRERRFDGENVLRGIIEILRRAIAIESAAAPTQRLRSVLAQGYVEVGVCLERLDELESALTAYDDALRVDPDNDGALTARGMLQMARHEVSRAALDFERAVGLGTPLVWPYLHLAFQALKGAEYARCIELCGMGILRSEDERHRAAFYEWMVVSELMLLRSPPNIMEELFERAMDHAPLNIRIPGYRDSYVQRSPVDVGEVPWELSDEAANDNARREILRRVATLGALAAA